LHNILERRAARQRLDEVMLENLIQADALIVTGLLPETTQRNLSMQYFAMHRCEEGLAVLQYVIDGHGPYAPPSAALLYYQGGGAYCQGELEKAIDYLNRAIAIEALPNAVQLRAEALYMLGRYDEARQDLDGLIEAKPYYNGGRYYQRAAVQYALGDRQAAEADLHTGDANTWGRYGWRPYVTALMARDDGDAETAVQDFQEAFDTLSWYEYPLFDDIQAELEKLGAQPLPEEASVTLRTTPLPTPQPTATRWAEAVDRLATQAAGGIVPPDSGRLAIERGLTSITYQNTNQARAMLTYYFAPSKETVAIDTVSRLVFHLEPEGAQPDKYELFLWDFHTGEWFMFRPGWGEIDLEDPGRFVTPEGEVYFLIRPDVGYTITFERLWAEIDATQTDGSPLHLGVAP